MSKIFEYRLRATQRIVTRARNKNLILPSWHHHQRAPRWWIGMHDHSYFETDRKSQRATLQPRDLIHVIRRHILLSASSTIVCDDCHERPLRVLRGPTRSRWRHCIGRCQWLEEADSQIRWLPRSKGVDRIRRVGDDSVVLWYCWWTLRRKRRRSPVGREEGWREQTKASIAGCKACGDFSCRFLLFVLLGWFGWFTGWINK